MRGHSTHPAIFLAAATGVLLAALTAPWWAALGLVILLVGAIALAGPGDSPDADGHQHQTVRTPTSPQRSAPDPAPGDAGENVVVYDAGGGLLFSSPSVPRSLGWQVNVFSSLRLDEFIHGADMARVEEALAAIAAADRSMATIEARVRTPNEWRWTELTIVNGLNQPGVGGFVVHQLDITDRRAAVAAEADRGAQLHAVGSAIGLALANVDTHGVAQRVASAVREALGIGSCEVYISDGRRLELVGGVGPGGSIERRQVTIGADDVIGQCALRGTKVMQIEPSPRFRDIDDSAPDAIAVALPLASDTQGVLAVRCIAPRTFSAADLSFLTTMAGVIELAERQRDAEHDAFHRSRHDMLTGLVNRSVFFEHLQRAITRTARQDTAVAVMLIDLDNFKLVNDSLGHAAGDAVLEAVSERLALALRPGDVLARFGGDEFVVMASGVHSIEQAVVQAERIRRAAGGTIAVAGHDVTVTASAGVAVAPDDAVTAEEILQHADAAVGEAKTQGRERTEFFTPELLAEAVTRLRTEAELREALTEGQLRVFYQPIVDLSSGRTVAAEALVRWAHPGRGLVAPDEFIPISEETGLIEEIGAWVIRESIAQAAAWEAEGGPMTVSVNLSARQLGDPRLLATIDQALDDHGLDPRHLAVELTESTILAERSASFETLQAIAGRGISVAIDDFGTGYSSLAYLQSLPVDTVKIDRTFIDRISRSSDDHAIAAAMIRLAQTLDKQVVAEGVETEEQLAILRELGCDLAQGFLFSPAVVSIDRGQREEAWSPLILGTS